MTPPNVSSVVGSNKLSLWLRWFGLGTGVLTLVWFPIEDTNTLFLTILSLFWATWTVAWFSTQPRVDDWLTGRWRFALLWAGAGMLAAPVALGLVLFKAGIHAHGFLDFSVYQLTGMLYRTPLWVLVGGVVGFFVSLMSRRRQIGN